MASFLRPRRGKKATAISQGLVLKRGEFFVEVPDSGVGTGVGKIKMGDGSTSYTNLPYLVSTEDDKIGFTDTSAATDPSNNPTYLTNIAPGNNLKTVFTNLKQLVYNHNTQLAELNNDSKIRYNSSTDWVQVYHESTWKNWKFGGMNIDPSKMELTQDEFVAICSQGLQSYMSVGAIIHVNNEYCNTLEVIDVEHDGVLNSVDVMAHTQVGNMVFGTSQNYNTSGVREWINSNYIDAFDYDVRELMKLQQVVTMGTTQNDKAKLLSWKEIGLTNYYMDNTDGGTKYPVFTAGAYNTAILDRWRGPGNYGNSSYYWLRSRYTDSSNGVWFVASSGTCGYSNCTHTYGVLPVLRF